jgi:membrane associated rhomboid family serine protease
MLNLRPFAFLPFSLRVILLVNAGFFVVAQLSRLSVFSFLETIPQLMVLVPAVYWQVWRLLSYAFLHIEIFHFLFNMLFLWMFAAEVVERMGERRFVLYYLGSAVFSGLVSVPFYLMDGLGATTAILGASGALFAVMFAYAKYYGERQILLFLIFPIQIKYAVPLLAILDLLMIGSGDGVAHLVHLGGFLAGFLYFQWFADVNAFFHKKSMPFTVFKGASSTEDKEVFIVQEEAKLDAILEKIYSKGMGSLSAEERKYLEERSRKSSLRGQEKSKIIPFKKI